jgi:hypothetical protein
MHGIDLIGLVAPQLRPREVADLSGIDDAHDVPSLMECKRDAQAVASGCLQAAGSVEKIMRRDKDAKPDLLRCLLRR